MLEHIISYKISDLVKMIMSFDNGGIDILTFLLEQGANINARNENDKSILHLIIYSDNYEFAKILVEKINLKNIMIINGICVYGLLSIIIIFTLASYCSCLDLA